MSASVVHPDLMAASTPSASSLPVPSQKTGAPPMETTAAALTFRDATDGYVDVSWR